MDTIEFLVIVAAFAVVMFWYLKNAEAGSDGLVGLLALVDDPASAKSKKRRAYRVKERPARKGPGMRDSRNETSAPTTYKALNDEDRMRQRYRRQDEARYRVKDKAASFKPKPDETKR